MMHKAKRYMPVQALPMTWPTVKIPYCANLRGEKVVRFLLGMCIVYMCIVYTCIVHAPKLTLLFIQKP